MAQKIKDIAVKTSTYTDKNTGMEKGRYENVGVLMQGDDGNQFMIMNRTFNPAGVPVANGKDTIILSLFEPQNAHNQGQNQAYTPQPAAQGQGFQQPQGGQMQGQPQQQQSPQQNQAYGPGAPVSGGY